MPGREPDAGSQTDTRLTVTEVRTLTGTYGTWTELEVWYWFHGDARPRRFRLNVDRHPEIKIGDLVRRHPQQTNCLSWWNHKGDRRAGRLLLVSEVEELPPL